MCSARRFAVAAGVLCRRRIAPSSLRFSLVMLSALAASRADLGASGSNTWYSGATSGSWPVTSSWGSGIFNTIVPGATSGTMNTDTAKFDSGSIVTAITPDANRNLSMLRCSRGLRPPCLSLMAARLATTERTFSRNRMASNRERGGL
jgi:hypothetical protein